MSQKSLPTGRPLLLLVDKNNTIGHELAEKLSRFATVVLVTKEKFTGDSSVICIPYLDTLPQIPNGLYEKIIFVWSDGETHLLDPLSKKAREENSSLFVILEDEFKEKAEEVLKGLFKKPITIVLGDIFGGKRHFFLDTFLYKAKSTKEVSLSNMGLHQWYPVVLEDAVSEIEKTILSPTKDALTVFIGPRIGLTALSLVHALQKIDPEIKVDFSKDKETYSSYDTPEREKSVIPEYESMNKLQKYYKTLTVKRGKQAEEAGEKLIFEKNGKKKKKSPLFIYAVYVVCVFLTLPIVLSLISAGAGMLLLIAGLSDLQKANFIGSLNEIKAARQEFSFSNSALDITQGELGLIGQDKRVIFLHTKIMLGYQIAQIAEDATVVGMKTTSVLSGRTNSAKNDISDAISAAKHASLVLQEVPAGEIPKQFQQEFLSLQEISNLSSNIIDDFPQLLGVTGERSYLVLFQNNMELRPGGGFIGSYGILKLNKGKINEFSIHDVYDADGQLKGHVEPPFAIRRYVPIVHLYLRDSNFDPDFTKDGQIAAQLLSQETGDTVDGVIGIDLDVLKSVLMATGNVFVPSYNEMVSDKNFFSLIEKHAEQNFFPGSSQKQDFLRSFFASLENKLQKSPSTDPKILLQQMLSLYKEKHILFAFADQTMQASFALSNLSGSLVDSRQNATSAAQLNDFLGISEANLGANKVNAFVTRKLSQNISLDDKGVMQETVLLTLTNASDGSWPGGPYKNFIRFLLPEKAVVESVNFDGVEQHVVPAVTNPLLYESKSFKAPSGLEVTEEVESGKTLYGFLVTVPEKSSKEITLRYTIPNTLPIGPIRKYNLLVWKQPGVSDYPYNMTISLPNSLQLLKSNVEVTKNLQSVSTSTTIDKDTSIEMSFITN